MNLRKQIGFIFQAHNLFGSLTAFQNVNMAAELVGMPRRAAQQRIEELLIRLDLGHRIHYKPEEPVGRPAAARGGRARAGPPTQHRAGRRTDRGPGQAKTGREVVTLFQEMARDHGCTIIIVTHDNRILDVADRIVNMVDGYIHSNVLVQESAAICEFLPRCAPLPTSRPRTSPKSPIR